MKICKNFHLKKPRTVIARNVVTKQPIMPGTGSPACAKPQLRFGEGRLLRRCLLAMTEREIRNELNPAYTLDLCAAGGEFFDDVLIAAVEVIYAVNDSVAISDKARQYQRH